MGTLKQISMREQKELLSEFCQSLLSIKNLDEALKFLTDLLTKREILILSRRIKVAKLLIEGKNYREIEGLLNVSHGTIAKVSEWLAVAGEGFRLIAKRTKKEKPKPPTSWDYAMGDWRKFKRKYPLYFWPELLIEEIIATGTKKQKEKIHRALEKLDKKSKLYKRLNKLLRKPL